MRLLKLAAYLSLGYLAYEFYQGLMHDQKQGERSDQGNQQRGRSQGQNRESSSSRDLHRALNRDTGRMNVSGPGRGANETVVDSDGGRSNRVVGRGVVQS